MAGGRAARVMLCPEQGEKVGEGHSAQLQGQLRARCGHHTTGSYGREAGQGGIILISKQVIYQQFLQNFSESNFLIRIQT